MTSSRFQFPEKQGFKKYVSDATNAPEDSICQPSVNCMINKNGDVATRLGYLDTAIDLGMGTNPVRTFYHETYDITVCIGSTKVKYIDHNNSDAVVDTGSTVTTATVTRMEEYLGDVYYTNTTDGLKRGVFGQLNGSAASGAGTVTVDKDMASRLSVFSKTSGNLIINGDSYAFNAVAISTGVITLNAVTLTQAYGDNVVCFVEHDISSNPGSDVKPSKLIFWKERMGLMGFEAADDADAPNNMVIWSKFTIGQVNAKSTLEDIVDFTYADSKGATQTNIGKGGKLTNIIGAKDYCYFLKAKEAYAVNADDISATGSTIGLTIPRLRDENHGCLNVDSAIAIGNNEIAYITNDKRILRIVLSTETGAAVVFPDENFDRDIWLDVEGMDDEQALAMAFYYKAQRKSIFQVSIGGQWYWLIYDHIIEAWQPPQLVIPASDFFERKGVLYATDSTTDTVYSIFTDFSDDGIPIDCTVASPEFDVDDAMMRRGEAKGVITHGTTIEIRTYVFNNAGGRRISTPKEIEGSDFTYGADRTIGATPIGGSSNAIRTQVADWKKDWDIFPQECNKIQVRATCEGDHFSLQRLQLKGDLYSNSFQKAL
tara:strand:+ start:872 stop:2668 length:1797 start_codon:yes stop_codon:yes gene_type:complete